MHLGRFLVIGLLLASVPMSADAAVGSLLRQRVCLRVERAIARNPSLQAPLQQRVHARFGFTCGDARPSAARVPSSIQPPIASLIDTDPRVPKLVELFAQSIEGSDATNVGSQALQDVLVALGTMSSSNRAAILPRVTDLALRFFGAGPDQALRMRTYSNFPALLTMLRDDGRADLQSSVRTYLERDVWIAVPGESPAAFNRRLEALRALWERDIAVIYWPNNAALLKNPQLHDRHLTLLSRIETYAGLHYPTVAAVDVVLFREDTLPTASAHMVWLPLGSSADTFIHESTHVREKDADITAQMPVFRSLYAASRDGDSILDPGDYATSYHPDVSEDLAEVSALFATTGPQFLERALKNAQRGRPLLLAKILWLVDTLWIPGDGAVPVYRLQDNGLVTDDPLHLLHGASGLVERIQWEGREFTIVREAGGGMVKVQ